MSDESQHQLKEEEDEEERADYILLRYTKMQSCNIVKLMTEMSGSSCTEN